MRSVFDKMDDDGSGELYNSEIRTLLIFFNDTATTEIYTRTYTLSLHDALP
eukprot:COSAG06_NODE_52586_length_305_cov_0.393204_1_plen_50_part_10